MTPEPNTNGPDSAAPATPAPPDVPPRMDSPETMGAAMRWGFETAMAHGARCITCVAPRFDRPWPLEDDALLTALVRWLRLPERRLVLLAADFADMGPRFPRFAQWRRPWVHAVPAWRCLPEQAKALPEALYDDRRVSVQCFDAETGRGHASLELRHRLLLAQQIDAILQRSEPAWPTNTLGL